MFYEYEATSYIPERNVFWQDNKSWMVRAITAPGSPTYYL